MTWLQILMTFAPMILRFIPKLAPIAPHVATGISEAEHLVGASSTEKQAHAVNIALAGVAAVNAEAGHAVIDPTIGAATIAAAVDTIVGVTNLVHAAHGAPAGA